MSELEQLRIEVAELRMTVVNLQHALQAWVMRQREVRANALGGDEDFLKICYDKSLLAKRRELVR